MVKTYKSSTDVMTVGLTVGTLGGGGGGGGLLQTFYDGDVRAEP